MQGIRDKSRPLAAQVLALLVTVWLNLALSPCVMAMDGSMAGHVAGEGMHDAMQAQDSDESCPHCPKPESPCDRDADAACALVDQVTHHGNALLAQADTSLDLGLPCEQSPYMPRRLSGESSRLPVARPPDPSSPLYLVHCRFLK